MKLLTTFVCLQFGFSGVSVALPQAIYNQSIELNDATQSTDNNQFDQWVNVIKDSSAGNDIQLFITRDVSLIYQQSLIVTNYMLINNKGDASKIGDYYWVVNQVDYDSKKWNFDYFRDYDNNLKIIDNTSNLNESIDHPYDNWLDATMIAQLLEYFTEIKKNDFKIDLWISDINIEELWNAESDSNSLELYNLLKHTDKINIISDGNYQTKYFALNFVSRADYMQKQLSKEEAAQKIADYRNDTNNDLYDEFKSTSIFDFLLDDSYINVFNIANYSGSPFYKLPAGYTFYPVYVYQYDYYSMANLLFDKTQSDEQTKLEEFIKLYESFFYWDNINSFEDLILENADLYDPTKKNVFFIGDSLITDESEFYPQRREELTKITEALLKKYSPTEYNWFFKGHPRYSIEVQKYLNSFMFDEGFEPIYLKNFPWEMFLSWDNIKQQEDSNYSPFFSNTVNTDNGAKSILVGLQYTSTVIESTWFFLKNVYNLDDLAAYNSINADNFPIAGTFDIIRPTQTFNFSPQDMYEKNYQGIVDIHEPFYELQNFYDYKKDLISSKDFINSQGISYNYPAKPISMVPIIIGVIVGIVIIIIVIILVVKFCVLNKKKNKSKG